VFYFTEEQKIELQILSDQAQEAMNNDSSESNDLGLWSGVYDRIYDFITDNDAPKGGVDPAVWIWVHGASMVNSGQGLFGDLIRQYTSIQYSLRYGEDLDLSKLNKASNNIAYGFYKDALDLSGEHDGLPGISQRLTEKQVG
jgi:hypothetical protein